MSATVSTNGADSAVIQPPEAVRSLRMHASSAEIGAALDQWERIEVGLHGLLPMLDLQETKAEAKGIALYTRLLRAHAHYLADADGTSFALTGPQRERLDDLIEDLDDLADTLAWAVDAREELRDLISQELR